MAQSVEHVIGNDEVISSILITSSKKGKTDFRFAFFDSIAKAIVYNHDEVVYYSRSTAKFYKNPPSPP